MTAPTDAAPRFTDPPRIGRHRAVGTLIALCLVSGPWYRSVPAQDIGTAALLEAAAQAQPLPEAPDAFSRLPQALIALRTPVTLNFPEGKPLETVLKTISDATRTPRNGPL